MAGRNGTLEEPGYWIFDGRGNDGGVIEVEGEGTGGRRWELKGSDRKAEVVAVNEETGSLAFTTRLVFRKGNGLIAQIGLFVWLMTGGWE
jgi:hypothetical protein